LIFPLLDDEDLQEHLFQLVREDGQVDTDELQIVARRGGGLFGKSRAERHRMLLSILTDVAGIREIVDHLEIQRLAWERSERSKDESAQDIQPGAVPDQDPTAVRKIRCSATRRESHTSRR
jgi:hypothetical protein